MSLSRDNLLIWIGVPEAILILLGLANGMLFEAVVFFTPVAVIVGVLGWMAFSDARPYTKSDLTGLRPANVRAIARNVFDAPGWVIKRDTPNVLTYERRMPYSVGVAIMLALLGLIPAIIYIVAMNNRYQTASIRTSIDDDSTLVEITVNPKGSNGHRWVIKLWELFDDSDFGGADSPPSSAGLKHPSAALPNPR